LCVLCIHNYIYICIVPLLDFSDDSAELLLEELIELAIKEFGLGMMHRPGNHHHVEVRSLLRCTGGCQH
jgi:hypothetical protein